MGLIGPNGSGKTTLFDCLSRVQSIDGGQVFFKGVEITRKKPFQVARLGMARTFQVIRVYRDLSIIENMLLSRQWRGEHLLNLQNAPQLAAGMNGQRGFGGSRPHDNYSAEMPRSLLRGGSLHTPVIIAFLNERLNSQIYQTIASLIDQTNSAGADVLSDEHDALRATFGRYAADKVAPLAEQIHREDLLLPDSQIEDLAAMGCFGITIPTRYGGLLDEDNPDHTAMVIISEELSRASFPTAGSLITRPELLSKALLKGGTEEQKEKWLPLIASGQRQVAVAVTEPDYGSNVASLRTTARPADGGWRISGTKTWSTFEGRSDTLMVLARTDPDLSKAHRGLSLFIAEKPPAYGHSFEHSGRKWAH